MPIKDRELYLAYQRQYQKARYARRRAEAIAYLGGECIDCGISYGLQFDHVDPATKSFNVSGEFTSMSDKRLYEEIDKCVLRCVACHGHMTALQILSKFDILGEIF